MQVLLAATLATLVGCTSAYAGPHAHASHHAHAGHNFHAGPYARCKFARLKFSPAQDTMELIMVQAAVLDLLEALPAQLALPVSGRIHVSLMEARKSFTDDADAHFLS